MLLQPTLYNMMLASPYLLLSDFVADVRAATPTHAAQLAVVSKQDLDDYLKKVENSLKRSLQTTLAKKKLLVEKMKAFLLSADKTFFTLW